MTKQFKAITFGEWLDVWFETYKKPFLKPTSIRNIEQMIRLHTPETLKQKQMVKLTVFDFDKAISSLPRGRTLIYARQVWNASFSKAVKLGIVDRNLLAYVDNIRYKKVKGSALTIKEQKDFLNALEGKRFKWLMLFYIYSGVRRGEALTIEWSDIDEEENLILIRGTKTESSYRHIILTKELKEIVDNQRIQREKEKTCKGRGKFHKAPDSIIFPFTAQQVSRYFKEVCPAHHLHDLRHTFITRCAESGVNITVCQQLVGHSTADMTLNVYTHVYDEFKRKEALKYTLFPSFDKKKDGI